MVKKIQLAVIIGIPLLGELHFLQDLRVSASDSRAIQQWLFRRPILPR